MAHRPEAIIVYAGVAFGGFVAGFLVEWFFLR